MQTIFASLWIRPIYTIHRGVMIVSPTCWTFWIAFLKRFFRVYVVLTYCEWPFGVLTWTTVLKIPLRKNKQKNKRERVRALYFWLKALLENNYGDNSCLGSFNATRDRFQTNMKYWNDYPGMCILEARHSIRLDTKNCVAGGASVASMVE